MRTLCFALAAVLLRQDVDSFAPQGVDRVPPRVTRQIPAQRSAVRLNVLTSRQISTGIRSPLYWEEMASGLDLNVERNLGKGSINKSVSPTNTYSPVASSARDRLVQEGYIQLDGWEGDAAAPQLDVATSDFAAIIGELADKSIPPQFLLMYDEVWDVINALSATLEPLFGLVNMHDFYIFNVKPGTTGWSLHRDRSGADTKFGFQTEEPYNDSPCYTTVWLALTDAPLTSSCIYVLPAHADPEYRAKDNEDPNVKEASLLDIISRNHQHIRALPVKRGTALVWSHRVIHWGSASPPDAPNTRRTLTFAMATEDYEEPLLNVNRGELPPFEARLAIVAYTLISYHHQAPVNQDLLCELVSLLADTRYSQHLTDAALSPPNSRSMANTFQKNLKLIHERTPVLARQVEAIAHCIVKERGLSTVTDYLRNLATKHGLSLSPYKPAARVTGYVAPEERDGLREALRSVGYHCALMQDEQPEDGVPIIEYCYEHSKATGMLKLKSAAQDNESLFEPPRWVPAVQSSEKVLVANGWSFLDNDKPENSYAAGS